MSNLKATAERAVARALEERDEARNAALLRHVDKLGGDHANSTAWYDSGVIAEAGNDAAVGALRGAHKSLHDGLKAIREAAATRSPEMPPEAHMMNVRRQGENFLSAVARRTGEARKYAEQKLTEIDSEIGSAIGSAGNHAHEIRAYLRSLPGNDAAAIVMDAAEKGDRMTLAAALDGPTYLSGLTDEQRRVARDSYLRTHMAATLTRRAAIEQALQVNRLAFDEAAESFFNMFDAAEVKKVQDADERAQAAAAKIAEALAG